MPFKTASESVNDLDLKWFEKTSLKLIDGKFQYSVRRRIKIPKPNSTELRLITISSPRTKTIEKALLNDSKMLYSVFNTGSYNKNS